MKTFILCSLLALPLASAAPAGATEIRIHGDDSAATVVRYWKEGFEASHPGFHVSCRLLGSGPALAGLYSGTADIAIMGREPTPYEHDCYIFAMNKAEPFRVDIMNGSLDVPGKSPALAVFVNRDNPLEKLTVAQLEAIVGTEHRRGPENLRTWDRLGLGSDWSGKEIHAYVPDAKTGTGMFLNQRVLKDSSKWNWGPVREFKDIAWTAQGFPYDAGQQIVDAVARDRFGIGVASLRYATPSVRALPLAESDGGPYVEATADNVVSRSYPLGRAIVAFANRAPGKPLNPEVKAFLEYVLGAGQADVRREAQFLPLSSETAQAELAKLQ